MKTTPPSTHGILRGLSAVLFGIVTLTCTSQAKEKHSKSKHLKSHTDHEQDDRRRAYHSVNRTSFHLSLGNGYAGRGYYYGPANASYYYAREGVHFYNTRESAPRQYYSELPRIGESSALVQRALSRRGYYNGPIDGQIGPQTKRAVARYQNDHGLYANGNITQSLLASLGIR